jgi:hypothetical protein
MYLGVTAIVVFLLTYRIAVSVAARAEARRPARVIAPARVPVSVRDGRPVRGSEVA